MMKQIAVTVPDNKEQLFMDIMKSLSFVKKVETIDDIPQWHKAIIDQRLENYEKNPDSFRDWNDVQKEINQKYGF